MFARHAIPDSEITKRTNIPREVCPSRNSGLRNHKTNKLPARCLSVTQFLTPKSQNEQTSREMFVRHAIPDSGITKRTNFPRDVCPSRNSGLRNHKTNKLPARCLSVTQFRTPKS